MTGKRSYVFYTLNCKSSALSPSSSSDSYQSKKSRYDDSPIPEARVSLISRFHRYPELKSQIKSEPHVPVRHSKFRGFQNSYRNGLKSICSVSDSLTSKMLKSLRERLVRAKEAAFRTLRFSQKEDEEGGFKDDEVVEVVNVEDELPKKDDEVVEVVNVEDEPSWSSRSEEDEIMDGNLKGSVNYTNVNNVSNENSMVTSTEKMLDSLSLTGKDRLNDVEKKYHNLDPLQLEIEINERQGGLQQTRLHKIVEQAFKPLTKDEENQVTYALSNYQRQKLVVTHESSNIDITGDLLRCLRPHKWLNDEVINLYLELLKERENRDPQKFLKCHFFNTFFYKKLTSGKDGYNFQSVRRWTLQRKLGYFIFDCDMIFVPIHKEVHWCLAVINKKEEKFQYLDSLGDADSHVMEIVARYFIDEVKEKNGIEIDVSSWKHEFVEDLPKQTNGYDCGVFMIKYVDFYSRGIGLHFNQECMSYFRQRTANEILKLKAE